MRSRQSWFARLALVFAAATAIAAGMPVLAAAPPDPTLHALGALLSRNLDSFELQPGELAAVQAGFADGLRHRKNAQNAEAFMPQIQALQNSRMVAAAQREKQAGQRFLEQAAALPGARRTESGLVYQRLVEGSGARPAPSDQVKVHYTGKLIDGTVFDSSVARGQAAVLTAGGVIRCWSEALGYMQVGGKSRVVCPSELAYGDRGAPPRIKPGAALDFEIELIEILPAAANAAAAPK